MKYIYMITFIMFFHSTTNACINEYGHTLEGKKLHTRYFYLTDDMKSFDKNESIKRLEYLFLHYDKSNIQNQSDIAYHLIRLRKIDSAISILEPLAITHPNEYNIIANLGTAYELDGQLGKALQHIEKGIQINPNAHHKSEWIHKQIVIAKIIAIKNPKSLRKNLILNEETLKKFLKQNSIERLNRDIQLQVRTRVPFTPAPNLVISNLLLSLGDINSIHGTYENAIIAYAYALDFTNDRSLRNRIKQKVKKLNRKRSSSRIDELPYHFLELFKKSKIDPTLLTIGLKEFANQQDSLHQEEHDLYDIIKSLNQQIDSLESFTTSTKKNVAFSPIVKSEYLKTFQIIGYIIIGIIISTIINLLILWIRKKKRITQ